MTKDSSKFPRALFYKTDNNLRPIYNTVNMNIEYLPKFKYHTKILYSIAA